MNIRGRKIEQGRCYVVAEAGTNHASPDARVRYVRALSLVREAAVAGADAIKFQIFVEGEDLFCPAPGDEKRLGRWARTVLKPAQWSDVAAFAHSLNLAFIGSAFQPSGVNLVNSVCDAHKIAVRAVDTYPVDKNRIRPVICSTVTPHDEARMIGTLAFRQSRGLVLHCQPVYPCPRDRAKLERLESLRHTFGMAGYSDHCRGPWMAIKAIALGAVLVEKHFVIFDTQSDPDGTHAVDTEGLRLIADARDNWHHG